jgi:molybdate transport system regulatory protein
MNSHQSGRQSLAEKPKFVPKKVMHFSQSAGPGYSVGGRVWLEKDGELYLGWGRVLLLEKIDELGSLAAAARSMNLAYRNAWLWVESMNRLAPSALVKKASGGAGGTHVVLTEEGRQAIKDYKDLRHKFQKFIEKSKPPD